ncbi:MAG: Type pilus biosis protein PilM [Planctomycetota bacterium]|jgi:Tfp pilus assembly PilM family ATPase
MASRTVAIDVGSHTVKVLGARVTKSGIQLQRFGVFDADAGARGVASGGIALKGAVCGLAGRDMNLRYSQVPPTPDWQLRNLMDLEIQDLAQQSGGTLSADYNLLPPQDPEAGVDTVLLALAKDESLERLGSFAKEAGGSVDGFTPNCVALYNAYLKCGPVEEDAVVCLANLGHETIDIALVKGVDLLFARNLSGGGKVLDDAIAGSFNVSAEKAQSLKHDLLDLDPASRGRFASGQAEKVTMAAGGAANAIVAAIQSSVAFCKAQTKIADLKLDKVLLAGGSANLRGLKGMLREALRCPVETFDPFANLDLSALPAADAELLQQYRSEAVVALGLAAARLDDTLYALEILPDAVRKRKRFAERTVFNVAAVAVAAVLLVVQVNSGKAQVEAASTMLAKVKRQKSQATGLDEQAVALVAENARDRALVEHLQATAMPLHGAVRALRALQAHLPPEFWVRKFEVGVKGGSGRDRKPQVLVEGAGKELGGVDVGAALLQFSKDFRGDPLLPREGVTFTSPPGTGSTVQFQFTIDLQAAATAPKQATEGAK